MSAERLQRLIALTREHDAGLYAWLAAAVVDHRTGLPLDQALGLSGTRAVRERDEALAAATEAMDPRGLLSTWARAGRLSNRLAHFEFAIWPRYADKPTSAPPAGGVNHHLVRAWRTGQRIPRSQRALFEILKNHAA